jgi:O-antigen biosynthesis protein WbqP
MEQAESLHTMISEDTVLDLKRVYITKRFYCKIKHLVDMLFALLGLTVLLIPFAVIAAVIYMDDPGKILFTQYRIGRLGKRFKLYQFRTMKQDTPKYLSTREGSDPNAYITRAGHFPRKYSLDELPQLINVLKGDMSLVGPRPLISDEYEIHAMRMRFGVYSIRPGVTGLAQIHGRDLVSPADKVRWDVKYLQDFGMWEDVKILFLTIPKIFEGEGVVEGAK